MTIKTTFLKGLVPYKEKAVLANFLLGWAEAFPLALILGVLGYWLSSVGVDKKTVGVFALASAPYALKVFWAPLLDRLSLGTLTQKFGLRRGWLFLIQFLMMATIIGMATTDPAATPFITGVFAFTIGILSASQDIIIDAYRIEIMERHQYGHGATMLTYGYRAGGLATGAGALFAAAVLPWELVIMMSPIMLLPGILAVLWVGEPQKTGEDYIREEEEKAKRLIEKTTLSSKSSEKFLWFYDAVILPLKEFLTRPGWWLILLFILLFKVADALAAVMTPPFLIELGFSLDEIATISKGVGGVMLWVGVFAGSLLYGWLGLYRSLMITAVLMMLTNLMYVWLANAGQDLEVLAYTVAAENFASGLGNVAVIAFLSALTNRAFTATQYALFSSISNIGRATIGSYSGYAAAAFGWADFFIFSALSAIPSIIILWVLWKKGWAGMRDPMPEKNNTG